MTMERPYTTRVITIHGTSALQSWQSHQDALEYTREVCKWTDTVKVELVHIPSGQVFTHWGDHSRRALGIDRLDYRVGFLHGAVCTLLTALAVVLVWLS